jgi:flagellar biosynthesis/type III secretory pathway M-ring protein FliF/YscJ
VTVEGLRVHRAAPHQPYIRRRRPTATASVAVMLRQSLRLDGNQIEDAYELRLDASLPKRDPRDRDPGVSGCK